MWFDIVKMYARYGSIGTNAYHILYDPRKISYRDVVKEANNLYHKRGDEVPDLFIEVKYAYGFAVISKEDIINVIEEQFGDNLKEGWKDEFNEMNKNQILKTLLNDCNIYYYQTGNWKDKLWENLYQIGLFQGDFTGTASLVPIPFDYFHYNTAMDNIGTSIIQTKDGEWRSIDKVSTKMSKLVETFGEDGSRSSYNIGWLTTHKKETLQFIEQIYSEE
jgi:hypothetical protein